jgi:lambda family phage portal protein
LAGRELALIANVARERRAAFVDAAVQARASAALRTTRRASTLSKRSIFAAGAVNRLNADWIMGPMSADQALRMDLRALRDRARQLRRDNAMAARFVRLAADNIIGPDGMILHPRAQTPSGDLDEVLNKAIREAWDAWCEPDQCSVDGRYAFPDLERLAVEVWKCEGECLIHMVPGFGNQFGFALQLLDADQLDHEYNFPGGEGRNEIRLGVEIDVWGRPVAYHCWTAHPTDLVRGRKRERILAEHIVHLYRPDRPGQTRGITPFASVMQDMRMLAGTQEALLVLLRTAACKMGFISQDPEKSNALNLNDDDATDANGNTVPVAQSMQAEPGLIERLADGEVFNGWDPGQPGANYDTFTTDVRRDIAVGLGVAYSSLCGDLSQANYGSQRQGLLAERDGWRRDQADVRTQLHDRVFLAWLSFALLKRAIVVPGRDLGYDVTPYRRHHFQPRGFEWIDPAKDIDVTLREVEASLNSLTRVASGKGRDFEVMLEERARENKMAEKLGVKLTLNAKANDPNAADPNESTVSTPKTGAPARGIHVA